MTDIDFSVVMPVRNNIDGLRIALGAFNLFTVQRDKFEVILVVDDDDPDAKFYNDIRGKFGYQIRVMIVKRSDNFCNDYYNAAAKIARGKNIWVFNDDCYVQTNGWDEIIRFKISKNEHFRGVYLIDMMDSSHNDTPTSPFPRFPMISKQAIDLIGFTFFPQVRMYPGDKVIWDLYHKIGCVITAHEIKLQHDHDYDHSNNPLKTRYMRILEEDKANGVFPVKADREAKILFDWITNDQAKT